MKFVFIAKHRTIWPVAWLCNALGVSRSGFHAWLNRTPSARSRSDEVLGQRVKASFVASDRTYGARRVWHDMLDGLKYVIADPQLRGMMILFATINFCVSGPVAVGLAALGKFRFGSAVLEPRRAIGP